MLLTIVPSSSPFSGLSRYDPSPLDCDTITPASTRFHSASAPSRPVVTFPSRLTSSSSALNPPLAKPPQAVNAGCPGCCSPLDTWNADPMMSSSLVMVRLSWSSFAGSVQSGSFSVRSSGSSSWISPPPVRLNPPTVTCVPPPPSRRRVSPSTTWPLIVRPNWVIQARGMGSRVPPGQGVEGNPSDEAAWLVLDDVPAIVREEDRGLALRMAHPDNAPRLFVHRADGVLKCSGRFGLGHLGPSVGWCLDSWPSRPGSSPGSQNLVELRPSLAWCRHPDSIPPLRHYRHERTES